MKFKTHGAKWEEICPDTAKLLLKGHIDDNEIDDEIEKIKIKGGRSETLTAFFKCGEDEMEIKKCK